MSISDRPDMPVIKAAMAAKGYKIFKNPNGHDLNIVGIRTEDLSPDAFNDWITVFYLNKAQWNYFAFPATTDPGTYYRTHPINVKGTAVMKPGQYRSAYKIGRHRGYKALQQKGPVTVYRDNTLDEQIDIHGMEEDTGLHAVNIHRANGVRPSVKVGKWSAGCQVFQDPDHFSFFLSLCERGKEKYGNSFTYTLLEEADLTELV